MSVKIKKDTPLRLSEGWTITELNTDSTVNIGFESTDAFIETPDIDLTTTHFKVVHADATTATLVACTLAGDECQEDPLTVYAPLEDIQNMRATKPSTASGAASILMKQM